MGQYDDKSFNPADCDHWDDDWDDWNDDWWDNGWDDDWDNDWDDDRWLGGTDNPGRRRPPRRRRRRRRRRPPRRRPPRRRPPRRRCPRGTREYVVRRGDTFFSIARRFGTTVAELRRVNPGIRPEDLVSGQIICVPVARTFDGA
ncbi:LysM peptidoglycan-binding domain-containing protein [Natroniella sulfidigena]|uniref:LysM peptidoglycan-binding domain-containing protein n=1 Tax=Natroniella sulfidigena TaxID=723921 RepID=UPI00200B142B|nr:LysM peptidoglycan-binding domain-containing protein [Natroniella sulfidigena]MCK8818063.1 LysM peptidoglycan-binding domain-containing protein [Natroniella sulfidigena]